MDQARSMAPDFRYSCSLTAGGLTALVVMNRVLLQSLPARSASVSQGGIEDLSPDESLFGLSQFLEHMSRKVRGASSCGRSAAKEKH